jgi:prepilin-type N-terminal cleavage/methylation domain-containing protein
MNGHDAIRRTLAPPLFRKREREASRRLVVTRFIGSNRPAARGFTLVELLVTVTIIGILASMMLGAVYVARESAREVKTKSTITKLHAIVMRQYESYRTRRVPVRTAQLNPNLAARVRLAAIRQTMRLEMPERWSDLAPAATSTDPNPQVALIDSLQVPPVQLWQGGNPLFSIPVPALASAYRRRYDNALAYVDSTYPVGNHRDQSHERLNRYSSAECLYMIVTMGGGAEAREQFNDSEIGDADGDGLPEFHDAWGNPILFLRWAPGITESDLQAQTYFLNTVLTPPQYVLDPVAAKKAAIEDHDPFDYRNLFDYAYRLVPLIYSAGPDGIYDINFEPGYSASTLLDPFYFGVPTSPDPNDAGAPVDSRNESVTAMDPPGDSGDPQFGPKKTPNSLDHYDNIDNHHLEAD